MKFEENTHKNNVARFFSHSVKYWEEVYESGGKQTADFLGYAKNRRKSIVVDYLDAYAGYRSLTVLDIGCGPGVFMEEGLRRGHDMTGIDISEEMIGKARARLEKHGYSCFKCQQGDAENIPLEDETADVVLCLGVLPYLRDDRRAVEEIDRVLKKGGMVIALLPNLFKLGNLLDPYYYLVRIWHYLWYGLLRKSATSKEVLDPVSFNENKQFGVRRYSLDRACAIFSRYGAVPEECKTSIEFGPLTLWKKEILSDERSIALSEFLWRLSSRWNWLKNFSNEWVINFKKPLQRGEL